MVKLKMQSRKTPNNVVVYSESSGDRDYLRGLLEEHGFNTICFENENICIDNFRSLQPKIVIARTDSSKVGWRFVSALNLLGMNNPLVFASHTLTVNRYNVWPLGVPIYSIPIEKKEGHWLADINHILSEKSPSNDLHPIPPFLGESDTISAIRSMLPNLADSKDSILIVGEKGTGKELLSRNIFGISKTEPDFVKVDCAALKLEMSLRHWLAEIVQQESDAKSIIILFSNIHYMTRQAQMDVLLFLDKVEGLLSDPNPQLARDIRIIATSEINIEALVNKGTFRKDLYYRINVIPISIPPLRERKTDIFLLMDYFSLDTCIKNNKCVMIPSRKIREMLYQHDWPGNVEELRSYMDRVVATGDEACIMDNSNLSGSKLDKREYLFNIAGLEVWPESFEIEGLLGAKDSLSLKGISREFVSKTEKRFMKKALELTSWNRKKAAEILDISYKSMLNKMKAYDII